MKNQELIIEAGKTEGQYWRDIWNYRELFYFLAWRDILVRYKQTAIGFIWALLRPLLTMIVFTIVFGKLAKMPSDGVPYPILVFAALLPWQLFSNAFSESGNCLINNASLITKVYFPRLVIPTSSVIVSLVDFLISGSILLGLMAWYNFWPIWWHIIILPIFTLMAIVASMGAGLWIAAMNVKYRDFRYIIPFIVQFGLYISPIGFSSSVIPEKWRLIYYLNPMVGIIDGFRWALLGKDIHFYYLGFTLSTFIAIIVFASGLWFFRISERTFADII